MIIFETTINTLEQFKTILIQLPQRSYTAPCNVLSNSSIGQHTRHVIELFLCLVHGYDNGKVSYDNRERNKTIECDQENALAKLSFVQEHLVKPNKTIEMQYDINGELTHLSSNYFREVMYNLEHAIHHQALIRIGINFFTSIELPESFGVAPSTMQYRKKECAR